LAVGDFSEGTYLTPVDAPATDHPAFFAFWFAIVRSLVVGDLPGAVSHVLLVLDVPQATIDACETFVPEGLDRAPKPLKHSRADLDWAQTISVGYGVDLFRFGDTEYHGDTETRQRRTLDTPYIVGPMSVTKPEGGLRVAADRVTPVIRKLATDVQQWCVRKGPIYEHINASDFRRPE